MQKIDSGDSTFPTSFRIFRMSSPYLPGTNTVYHTSSHHPTRVSSVSPNTYNCGFNQGQEGSIQDLQGMTVNMGELSGLSLASGAEMNAS